MAILGVRPNFTGELGSVSDASQPPRRELIPLQLHPGPNSEYGKSSLDPSRYLGILTCSGRDLIRA